jgi:O-antigen ligase
MSALFTDPQFAEMVLVRAVTFLQLVALLWVVTDLLKNQKMRKSVLLAYPMSALFLALGVIFGLPGIETRTGLSGRMTAIGQDANLLAGIMALAVVILIGMSMQTVFKYLLSKILLSVIILPLLLAIVKTGSRTGTLTVLIGSLMYLLPYRRSKRAVSVVILATCGVGVLVYLIATDTLTMKRWQEAQEGNLSTRERVLPTALGMISERPILGWHPVAFAYEVGARTGKMGDVDAHNLLLSMLGEVGVVGTIPFLAGLLLCFRAAWTARRGDLGLMPLALLSAALALNMGIPALLWKPFWLAMGLTLAAAFTTTTTFFTTRSQLKHQCQRLGGWLDGFIQ